MSAAESPAGGPGLELVLTGGMVFDPATGGWTRGDLGVRAGRIASFAASIEPPPGCQFVDVAGLIVTPGLIDLHLHAYPGATYWGIEVERVSVASGVTTVVDAGSAGAYNFEGLANLLRSSRLGAKAFLNIAGGGLAQPYGELLVPEMADVQAAVRVARSHPDLIVGFKLRASPNTVGPHFLAALGALRRAADDVGLPVMVHVSEGPPDLTTVLGFLRRGDILTHCFTPYDNCVVDSAGRVRPEAEAAVARGVILDVGHGSGSFSFPAAEAYVAAGGEGVVISTDLHRRSVLGPAFDLATVAAKMLAAKMGVDETLRAMTAVPATVLGHSASLAVGSPADIAVLEVEERPLKLWDSRGNERVGARRLACRLTVRDGEVVFADPGMRLRSG